MAEVYQCEQCNQILEPGEIDCNLCDGSLCAECCIAEFEGEL